MEGDDYRSEFEAPCFTTVDVRFVGRQVVRRVIMDGALQEFIVDRSTYEAGRRSCDRPSDTSGDVI